MGAETLVLVPGLMCDHAVWDALQPHLDTDVAVVVADHDDADSLEAMAQRVLSTASPRFALAGHSMGGRVALEVLRLAPERVSRVALLNTGFRARAPGPAGEAELQARAELLRTARTCGLRAMARTWVQGMVDPARLRDAALIEAIVTMFERKRVDVFEAQVRALLGRPDATPVLATIAVPALVLCGRHDHWAPVQQHEALAAAIDGAHLEVVEHAGHMAPMERPEVVAAALQRWLAAS